MVRPPKQQRAKTSDEIIRELLSKLKEFLCENDELYLKLIRKTITFDELADGLANIIGHYVSKELEIAAQSS